MRSSIAIASLLLSFPTFAAVIQVSGEKKIPYQIDCINSVGMKLHFEGTSPGAHSFSSRKPLKECTVSRHRGSAALFVSFDVNFSDGAEVYKTTADFNEARMIGPIETKKTIPITYQHEVSAINPNTRDVNAQKFLDQTNVINQEIRKDGPVPRMTEKKPPEKYSKSFEINPGSEPTEKKKP